MSKLIALELSIVYFFAAYAAWGTTWAFVLLLGLLIPLAFIWFGRDLAAHFNTNATAMIYRDSVYTESSGSIFTFTGWATLALLLAIGIIYINSFLQVLLVVMMLTGLAYFFYRRRYEESQK